MLFIEKYLCPVYYLHVLLDSHTDDSASACSPSSSSARACLWPAMPPAPAYAAAASYGALTCTGIVGELVSAVLTWLIK